MTLVIVLAVVFIFIYDFDQLFVFFAEGMNEDGSFIGQYGRKGKPQPTNNQAFATLV